MSDSDSLDSDNGIRYKTESVRSKTSQSTNPLKNVKKKRKYSSESSDSVDDEIRKTTLKYKKDDLPEIHRENVQAFGPSLPPSFNKKSDDLSRPDKPEQKEIIGPALPAHLTKLNPKTVSPPPKEEFVESALPPNQTNPSPETLGPALPPEIKNVKKNVIGPSLPTHLRQQLSEGTHDKSETSSEDEQETYGPLPVGTEMRSKVHRKLEERALQLKIDQLDPKNNDEPVRETWMLELPESKAANFGLGPRQFRAKAGPDMSDRSSWTEIAGKKKEKEKVDLKLEAEHREMQTRDQEQALMAKKHKEKNKSLVELHQQKLDQEKKVAGPSERRPFNRETDLQVNRFDEAQKKAVLKKAQLLDDRFSAGKAKYL